MNNNNISSNVALLITVVGIASAVYFLFFYGTTVDVTTTGLYGMKSIESVYNQGLMQNRQLGSQAGMMATMVGIILLGFAPNAKKEETENND